MPERVCYSGILAEIEEGPDSLSLVMVPGGTPEGEWGWEMPLRRGGLAECTQADKRGDLSAFQGWSSAA